jgi:hypothetical protein
MNLLSDVINYVRRIIKTSSNQQMSDATIIDYINRFYTYDVPARIQQFELKTVYSFDCVANIDKYNLPYDSNGNLQFQNLLTPVYVDGVEVSFMISRQSFYRAFPRDLQNIIVDEGDGVSVSYNFFTTGNTNAQGAPIGRAHLDVLGNLEPGVYVTAFDEFNNQMVLTDDGTFSATNQNVGNLIVSSYISGVGDVAGTVNYITGEFNVTFPAAVPADNNISAQYFSYQSGTPRIVLFFDNVISLRPIPDKAYLLEFDAYLTPAAFLNSNEALKFGYMSEYLARGAARKILSDVGDIEQFTFYEPLFREQEILVLRRTDRQNSVERTPTIFTEFQQQSVFNASQSS